MYARIIVPLDGSENAERALSEAISLAKITTSPIHLIRVVDISQLERYGAYGLAVEYAGLAEVLGEEATAAESYLVATAKRLADDGTTVTHATARGSVAAVICALATPQDLIVIASHGRTGVSRWFLGSVAEAIVRRAPCPVLVVRSTVHEH